LNEAEVLGVALGAKARLLEGAEARLRLLEAEEGRIVELEAEVAQGAADKTALEAK